MPRQQSDETTDCLLIAGATFLIPDVQRRTQAGSTSGAAEARSATVTR